MTPDTFLDTVAEIFGAVAVEGVSATAASREPVSLLPTVTASSVEPRPYQSEAVDAVLAAHAGGMRRQLVVLPTGCGKTIIFAQVLQQRPGRALRRRSAVSVVAMIWPGGAPSCSTSPRAGRNACGGALRTDPQPCPVPTNGYSTPLVVAARWPSTRQAGPPDGL